MKAILAILSATLLLLSCRKEQQPFPEQIIGKWQLTEIQDFTYPTHPTSHPTSDPGNYIEFNGSRFSKYRIGQKIDSGTYRVIEVSKMEPVGYYHEILYNNQPDTDFYETFVRIVDGKLELMITHREHFVEKHIKVTPTK